LVPFVVLVACCQLPFCSVSFASRHSLWWISPPAVCHVLHAAANTVAAARTALAADEMEVEEAAAARAAAAERAAAAAAGPTRAVSVVRPPEMEAARSQLPILGLEQEIMEGINRHDVVVSLHVLMLLKTLF
jgi:hypothetical protein